MSDEQIIDAVVRLLDAPPADPVERARLESLADTPAGRSERRAIERLREAAAVGAADSFRYGFVDRVVQATHAPRPVGATHAPRPVGATHAPQPVGATHAPRPVGATHALRPGRATRRTLARWALPTAAVVAVLLAVVLWNDSTVWTAPAGTTSRVDLSDGSTVQLAPGSRLSARPFHFRASRSVHLEGEAFFSVAAGARPFVVHTFNARVQVLGTRFNVRAWPGAESGDTQVALEEGSVMLTAVRPAAGGDAGPSPASGIDARESESAAPGETTVPLALRLTPGQTARIEVDGRAALLPQAPLPSETSAWRTGGLVFRDRPLADVLDDLERRFGVRLEASADVVAGRTATYMNTGAADVADVLDAVCFALDLRYRPIRGGFRLERPES